MKLARLIDERFHIALNKLTKDALPIKTAFKLKGIIKITHSEYEKYDELRQETLNKYGSKNEDGSLKLDERSVVQFTQEGIQAFTKEINELTNVEVEIPTVKLSELGDTLRITAEELELLDGVIVED